MYTKERLWMQYKRLERNYYDAINSEEQIVFLDLAHSLRYWTEIPINELCSSIPRIKDPLFYTSIPKKNITNILKNSYLWINFPKNGVWANAINNNGLFVPTKERTHCSIEMKVDKDGKMRIYHFIIVHSKSSGDSKIENIISEATQSKVNFACWKDKELFRIYDKETNNLAVVGRERFIKYVANKMDASHASAIVEENQAKDMDRIVGELNRITYNGIPLPFFILLKVAQDIVETFDCIIER